MSGVKQPPETAWDESLREAILARLAEDPGTAGEDLRVGVLNGIVHLAGSLETLERRAAAEEIAAATHGVRGVVNRIEAPGAPSPARTVNLHLDAP